MRVGLCAHAAPRAAATRSRRRAACCPPCGTRRLSRAATTCALRRTVEPMTGDRRHRRRGRHRRPPATTSLALSRAARRRRRDGRRHARRRSGRPRCGWTLAPGGAARPRRRPRGRGPDRALVGSHARAGAEDWPRLSPAPARGGACLSRRRAPGRLVAARSPARRRSVGAARAGADAGSARPAAPCPITTSPPLAVLPRVLATPLPDGHAGAARPGCDDPSSTIAAAPRAERSRCWTSRPATTGRAGEISVSFVTGADGRRRAIVDIPGTKSWNPAPHRRRHEPGHGCAARSPATQHVLRAGRASPRWPTPASRPDDEVMLVGHSEGGMVAVERRARRGDVRAVPRSRTSSPPARRSASIAGELPADVQLLALENTATSCPHSTDAPTPTGANVTTVAARRRPRQHRREPQPRRRATSRWPRRADAGDALGRRVPDRRARLPRRARDDHARLRDHRGY